MTIDDVVTSASRRTFMKIGSAMSGVSLAGYLGSSRATADGPPGRGNDGKSGIERTTVVDADPETTPRADSAQVIERPDGTLHIYYQKYSSGGGDHDEAQVYRKASHDGGLTWEDETLVVGYDDVSSETVNVMQPALTTLPDDEIVLTVLQKLPDFKTAQLTFRSTDGGTNFQREGYVWEPTEDLYRLGSPGSRITQLSSGRLVFPAYEATDPYSAPYHFGCYLSDDEGETWYRSSTWNSLPMRGAMEPSIAKLTDDELLMSLRTQLGSVFFSRSTDGGESWTHPQTSGHRTPEANTCLRRIPNTGDLVLIWNNHPYLPDAGHYGDRTPLAAAVSPDGGETWSDPKYIETNPFKHYSNINCNFLSSGDAIVTYWNWRGRDGDDLEAAVVPFDWFNRPPDTEVDFEPTLHPEKDRFCEEAIHDEHDAGLVGHYRLDEVSGEYTILDSSGYDHHGTNVGGSPVDGGRVGGAFEFDGGSFATVGYPLLLDRPDAATISGWFKTSTVKYAGLFGHRVNLDSEGGGLTFRTNPSNSVDLLVNGGNGPEILHSTSYDDGSWHHLAGTYDGREVRMYVDGSLEETVGYSEPLDPMCPSVEIGRYDWADSSHGPYYFEGTIDDVRVYNVALADEAISELASTGES